MFGLAVAITIVNVLVSAGFAIAGVLAPGLVYGSAEQFGTPVLVFALYAGARSVPLVLAVIFVTVRRVWPVFLALGAVAEHEGFEPLDADREKVSTERSLERRSEDVVLTFINVGAPCQAKMRTTSTL